MYEMGEKDLNAEVAEGRREDMLDAILMNRTYPLCSIHFRQDEQN